MSKQTNIPGTEPQEIPVVRDAVHAWLDAKGEARTAAERTKLRHDAMLMHMAAAGVDRYPYVDAASGKRKFVVSDKTPKAKTIAAADSPGRRGRRDREKDVEIGEEVTSKESATVESRRVSRTAAHDAVSDPFAATRGAMK